MAGVGSSLSRKLDRLRHPDLTLSLTTFSSLLDLKATHAHIITGGQWDDLFTVARLLASAAISKAGDLRYAHCLFSCLERPTRFMYNTMIRALSQQPVLIGPHSADYYARMLRSGIYPDRLTFPFLIRSCSLGPYHWFCRGVHCHAVMVGLDSDVYVVNNLISTYCSWGDMESARKVFDQCIAVADVVAWTALITGYANAGELGLAQWYFDRMPVRNSVSWGAIIAGYARNRMPADARKMFKEMPDKTVASWSAMISGFAQCGLCKEALATFKEMIVAGFMPNESALVSGVSASAQLRALEQGEWIHDYIEECKIEVNVTLGSALVDMYGKCGSVSKALDVFKNMTERNIFSWNSMITGLAMNGAERQALTLFWKMRLAGIEPNAITFIGVLSACSHSGMVDDGHQFFDLMTRGYGIRPMPEHYGCMVDLLGRAGQIKDALDFAENMPYEPHPGLLGALAGACRIHGEMELGELLSKRLIEMEPRHSGRYALLYNIYAAARRWDDAATVGKLLRERGVKKVPGNSKVEDQQCLSKLDKPD